MGNFLGTIKIPVLAGLPASGAAGEMVSVGGAYYMWNGTAWAGIGIAIDQIFDAKGDLPAGTGADAASRLPVGANGRVLSANSGTATGLEWVVAGGVSDGDKGDITVSGAGTVWTVDNDVVTFAKMQNLTAGRLVGNSTGAAGDPEEIRLGGGLKFTGTILDVVSPDTFVVLGADQANSTVTPASVTGLETTVAPGTYLVKYWVCFQSAAAATGIEMYLDHSGTTTRCVATWYTLTTGGAAATGVADQATTATAQMMEGKAQRAKNVASGVMQGVDTANADQFAVIEGILIVTVSGTLKLMFRSEVAASAVSIMAGTTLTLTKVA